MSPRTGRPPKANPKSGTLQIRLTPEKLNDLKECAEALGLSRTAVIERGIELVKKELGK